MFFLEVSAAICLSILFLVSCQVDDKKTVGAESFSRIAPACAIVADIITVHNLFDVLASSSGHRLHFLIYDKYLRSLEKYAPLLSISCWTPLYLFVLRVLYFLTKIEIKLVTYLLRLVGFKSSTKDKIFTKDLELSLQDGVYLMLEGW